MTVEKVTFPSGGATLAGDLYLPEQAGPHAAVVVIGTWTSVKEQMSRNYARGLAARGVVALAFDARSYGESGGEPRDIESPADKADDLRAAVEFLAARAGVDPARVSLLGICAGAMYAAAAAAGARVHRLALVAPWIHDRPLLEAIYGGAAGVADKLAAAAAARRRFDETGVVDYVPVASPTDPAAAMYAPAAVIDYYLNPARGAVPEWPNRFAVLAWANWLGHDGVALAPRVTVPTLLVHSEAAAIPDGARRFAAGLGGPRTERWLAGINQFQFYDDPAAIDAALAPVVEHCAR